MKRLLMAILVFPLWAQAEEVRRPTEVGPPAPRGAVNTAVYDEAKPINPPKPVTEPEIKLERAPPPVEVEEEEEEERDGHIPPPSRRDGSLGRGEALSLWSIMTVNTNSYASTGKLREKLMAGTVVKIISRHQTDQGSMMRCRIRRQDAWSEDDDFFIPESSLLKSRGAFEQTPSEQLAVMTSYYGLYGKILARQDEIRAEVIRANPHFRTYQKAAQELIAFREEQRALFQEAETLTGLRRTDANNKLRRMKSEEAELNRKFKQIEEKYRAWKEANDDGSRRFPTDATLQALERERAALEPKMDLLR